MIGHFFLLPVALLRAFSCLRLTKFVSLPPEFVKMMYLPVYAYESQNDTKRKISVI
jgi:hypothetical protein